MKGVIREGIVGVVKGDARSLDYSSYRLPCSTNLKKLPMSCLCSEILGAYCMKMWARFEQAFSQIMLRMLAIGRFSKRPLSK